MKVTEAQSTEEFEKWYQLRYDVLRKEWKQAQGDWREEHEDNCIYAMIMDEKQEALGICRLHFNSSTEAQIRYMGVRSDQQGKGLGNLLLNYLEKKAIEQGASKIILQSRDNAVDFYKKNGYVEVEKSHILWGMIQHFLMEKEL